MPTPLTHEQKAAAEARRAERQTVEYQDGLARDVAAVRQEFPPREAVDGLKTALAALRAERERQGLSLTDLQERTRLDRAMISKLELRTSWVQAISYGVSTSAGVAVMMPG